jgi:drug/metabolite transporter (DMT)-like permease
MLGAAIALLSTLFNGLALVLQREAHIKFDLKNVLKSRLWLAGITVNAAGFLLYSAALSIERIALVQPIMALSLAVTAITERTLNRTKNDLIDYIALVLIIAGAALVVL